MRATDRPSSTEIMLASDDYGGEDGCELDWLHRTSTNSRLTYR